MAGFDAPDHLLFRQVVVGVQSRCEGWSRPVAARPCSRRLPFRPRPHLRFRLQAPPKLFRGRPANFHCLVRIF
jgi:hypothetical protein